MKQIIEFVRHFLELHDLNSPPCSHDLCAFYWVKQYNLFLIGKENMKIKNKK